MSDSTSSRREFLEFFGLSTAALSFSSLLSESALAEEALKTLASGAAPFTPLTPDSTDTLRLAHGFSSRIVIGYDEKLNSKGEKFGYNNDYIAVIPDGDDQAIMWVNHESTHPLFVSGRTKKDKATKQQITAEQLSVGGSLFRIKRDKDGAWKFVANDQVNRRLSGATEIPLIASREIMGSKMAVGTLANCAGGVTPWQTVLTCEENYNDCYGEAVYDDKATNRRVEKSKFGWEEFFPRPPEHYGWVVEVNPRTGAAKKLTALGRFAHECATTRVAKDGRCVVYSGDDGDNRCLYKFISDAPGSLETGTLYVANMQKSKWVPVQYEAHEVLKQKFTDQTDVLIRCRVAAPLVGGSEMDRPEDIEIDKNGAVYVSLTNNISKANLFGSILKIVEKNNDPLATEFTHSTFVGGGEKSGIACPDNMVFDRKGNLWVTNDISNKMLNVGPYKGFGNNGLFYIPMSGPNAGKVYQVASGPVDAELTGPCFSPDGRTLFLSVQHPGDESPSLKELTSHWPDGGKSVPRPSVVALTGPTLDALVL